MITNYPEIRVKLDPGAFLPERAHDTDAGADIRTPKAFVLMPHTGRIVRIGVHIELPPTTKCMEAFDIREWVTKW